ncbi:MAG: YifB family Mg chelatase-like AAA ATPase [Spirochaetota bacterium]
MIVTGYVPAGFEGEIVWVEVDIRRGIPGIDIVGLADGAVKEARERVRVALKNSGFIFPSDRILINLSPAGVRKEGAALDLSIAVSLLHSSQQIPPLKEADGFRRVMILGELKLSGEVRPVTGVLSAIASGLKHGITLFLVPMENLKEAAALGTGEVYGIKTLQEAVDVLNFLIQNLKPVQAHGINPHQKSEGRDELDFAEIKGQELLKRALEIAAAGLHHVFIFGPPGSGKTMAARRFPTVMPDLDWNDSVTVTRIHSLAGNLSPDTGLISRPPFRSPHHSASQEGLIGGGRYVRPGEVSLAHRGVLFLDEATEFKKNILQALREPLEDGRVDIARAGSNFWFPARFQLILAANPCPCGNLGRDDSVCLCSSAEILAYWKKIGGALMDRIDIRIPVKPVPVEELLQDGGESSDSIKGRVQQAVEIQAERFKGESFNRNSRISPGKLNYYCPLGREPREVFASAVKKLSLSSRACHSILKLARTIADLEAAHNIGPYHLLEAVQHRRYGDRDFFWHQFM